MIKKTTVICGILAGLFFTQGLTGQFYDYPRDTSFTVWSTAQKISKDFPHAIPVKEFKNLPVLCERDRIYSSSAYRDLKMDIFQPLLNHGEKVAGVVCIHGGGWSSGDKSHLVPLAQKLAQNGFLAASVEYKLSPEAKYPVGVLDIKTAIRWLKEHAESYNLDTSKIAVLGTSAGATIATLVGTSASSPLYMTPDQSPTTSDKVYAIVNIDGILDFTDPAESGKDHDPAAPSAAARWFGCTYAENQERWREASPLNRVDKNSPPILFINSAIPRFHAGRDQFIEKLQHYGTYYQLHTIPDTPHPFWLFYPWFDVTADTVTDFLNSVFSDTPE